MQSNSNDKLNAYARQCAVAKIDISQKDEAIKSLIICSHLSQLNDALSMDTYSKLVREYSDANITFGSGDVQQDLETIPALVQAFKELYEVTDRPRLFLAQFHDVIVSDWDSLFDTLEKHMGIEFATTKSLFLVYYFHLIAKMYNAPESSKAGQPPYEYYLKSKLFPNPMFPIALDEQTFQDIWNNIFFFHLPNQKIHVAKELKDVIKAYDDKYIPRSKLLEDYRVVIEEGKDLPVINQWNYVRKKHKNKNVVESGLTIDESMFDVYACRLKDHAPTDVIDALFYNNQMRNDAPFEVGVLLKIFYTKIKQGDEVCLVNPSPAMLVEINRLYPRSRMKGLTCIVSDETIKSVYHKQFPLFRFLCVDDDTSNAAKYDVALITSRNWESKDIDKLLKWILQGNNNSTVMALLPNAVFDSKTTASVLREHFVGYSIRKIALLSTSVTNSSPKKKALLYLERSNTSTQNNIVIHGDHVNGSLFGFSEESSVLISENAFWDKKKSLLTLLKDGPEIDVVTPEKRSPAKEIKYSREIVFHYTIKKRGNCFVGRAYYCEMLSADECEARRRGNRITGFIEKGLRASSDIDLLQALETEVPYYNEVRPVVIRDIQRVYKNRLKELSLKTIWYCGRLDLLSRSDYNDPLSKQLFEHDACSISNILPDATTLSEYARMINDAAEVLEQDDMILWRQLNLLLNYAVENGYATYNPVNEHIRSLTNRASEEVQEVRNALTKKTFTIEEEKKIISFVSTIANRSRKKGYPKFICESVWLLGPIRLYTAMKVREICALTWRDFVISKSTGLYLFAVTKVITNEGKVTNHVPAPEKTFRRVPIVPELADMLLKRKQYLLTERRIAEKDLADMPIILEHERKKKTHCRPVIAAKISREIIRAIGIKENLVNLPDEEKGYIQTDLNQYGGDIFRSNFRYRANHTARLDRGEINYILAIAAPDTFSQHYCDYTNDYIQIGMAKKLQRWSEKHYSSQNNQSSLKLAEWKQNTKEIKYRADIGSIKVSGMIDIKSDTSDITAPAEMELESQYGLDGHIGYYDKEGK